MQINTKKCICSGIRLMFILVRLECTNELRDAQILTVLRSSIIKGKQVAVKEAIEIAFGKEIDGNANKLEYSEAT